MPEVPNVAMKDKSQTEALAILLDLTSKDLITVGAEPGTQEEVIKILQEYLPDNWASSILLM